MSLLPHPAYLDHIRTESRRFREVLAGCDPAARVPSCPGWDAADLLFHLAGVQRFWSTIVRQRPEGPEALAEPERPATYDGLLGFFDESSAALVDALEQADPVEQAWTWAPEQTVGFIVRRQAHEALIHRLDAELTAGQVTPLDGTLAADGVAEVLGVMYGGGPAWGTFTPRDGLVRFDVGGLATPVFVRLGWFTGTDPDNGKTYDEPDIGVVPNDGTEPHVVVAGASGVLDAWLWRRGSDEGIAVSGDDAVWSRFRQIVAQPIT
ncbi:maleylpyruvate isomerase family mycothiol-dependent enzyme [Nocardioides guangzhouensis]|uniref:Maleylpyruvate isomerase family mycothiol-dependent enzyme n=1 Tax=Nocardioides guangzhouensis TaxID=2497878 RepID=A0A4Q4ZEG6_9ACTN|nr:maleylpyruvate isomerase family mycothiol-dependent enzyme [Nocardioides guangzhouensis]RYP86035.1 maleylpyruvate isomerase family mycothiol-dependent enzyme [Nocardioides guangzhouensis]